MTSGTEICQSKVGLTISRSIRVMWHTGCIIHNEINGGTGKFRGATVDAPFTCSLIFDERDYFTRESGYIRGKLLEGIASLHHRIWSWLKHRRMHLPCSRSAFWCHLRAYIQAFYLNSVTAPPSVRRFRASAHAHARPANESHEVYLYFTSAKKVQNRNTGMGQRRRHTLSLLRSKAL